MTRFSTTGCIQALGRALLWFAAVSLSTSASARTYRITNFTSTIHVDDTGEARITEKITFAFNGAFEGVYRDIPTDYPGPRGSNYALLLHVDKISEENGAALKYKQTSSGGFLHLKILVPGAVNVTRTIDLEYSVPNATKFFEDHDEFYWNVTGN